MTNRRIDSITSSANAKFQTWKSLLVSKGIRKEKLFILSGEKVIQDFLRNPTVEISCELITSGLKPIQSSKPIFELEKSLFTELDIVGTHFNLLVLELPEMEESHPHDAIHGLEVVAPLGDPKNLGALIRTCVAFGVQKIHLTTESANPFHPQCLKASAGAVLHAHLLQAGDLKSWDLASAWALDAHGKNLRNIEKPKSARLIVGEEGQGLKGFEKVQRVSIPTENVESLNATVAASLVIYSWQSRQLG
jgi:TrmH family RNA methyltransferase